MALLAAPAAIGDSSAGGVDVVAGGVSKADESESLHGVVQVLGGAEVVTSHDANGTPTVTEYGLITLANPLSYADCHPAGAPASSPYLLPPDSVEFDHHGNLTLKPTVFDCTGVQFEGTFQLTVSLTFDGTIDMQRGQIGQDWPGTPLPTRYSATTTGSAVGTSPDGTTDFMISDFPAEVDYLHSWPA